MSVGITVDSCRSPFLTYYCSLYNLVVVVDYYSCPTEAYSNTKTDLPAGIVDYVEEMTPFSFVLSLQ